MFVKINEKKVEYAERYNPESYKESGIYLATFDDATVDEVVLVDKGDAPTVWYVTNLDTFNGAVKLLDKLPAEKAKPPVKVDVKTTEVPAVEPSVKIVEVPANTTGLITEAFALKLIAMTVGKTGNVEKVKVND